jgi:hypothetical protein
VEEEKKPEIAITGGTREQVVAEARTWLGTPYRKNGKVKGYACDCGTLPIKVALATGWLTEAQIAQLTGLSSDWWCHANEEKYMFQLLRHAHKILEGVAFNVTKPLPGAIVLVKSVGSRVHNHSGIVTKWPRVIHAVDPEVVEVNAMYDPLWGTHRQFTIFDFWEKS